MIAFSSRFQEVEAKKRGQERCIGSLSLSLLLQVPYTEQHAHVNHDNMG